MCGGNKNTTTSTTAPAPGIVPALNQAAQQVSAASQLPFQPVLQGTAGPTAQQTLAGNTLDYTAQPMLQGAANPLTAAEIQQYYNPYQQDVIAATQAEFNNQNAQQQNQVVGNAVSQGAWGGDRSAVAQALTAQQQQLAQAPVIAGLEQQGYNQALGTAAQQYQQNPEAVANQLTNLGVAQYGVGTQAQQTQQQAYNAQYAEQLAAAGYPFQAASFNAGNIGGLAGAFGGTSQTTVPPPSIWNAAAGLGTAGIGLAMLSDRRAKEDIRAIGKTKDGQTIYRFRYKGHPQWQIGLMAQDVEKKNPDAVHEIEGVKTIDIKKATDAAARAFGGRIQGLQTGGVPYNAGVTGAAPYAGPENYVPTPAHISGGIGLPRPTQQPQQDGSTQMFQNALKMAGGAGGSGNGLLTNTSFGDTVSDTLQDIGDAAGGRVPRAYGGLAIPSAHRINVPTRSGFGMPSFMSRGGLAEGGTPDDDVVTDTASPPPVVSEAAPEGVQVAQAAPPSGVATDALPPEITAGASKPKGLNAVQQKVWDEAVRQGVSPNLALGVLHAESADGRNPSTSSAGALGPMQLMPQTARGLGVDPHKEDDNIRGGVTYLKQMRDQFGSDALAAAAYNAGPGRVNQYQRGVPLPAETQGYVPKVLGFAGSPSGAPEGGLGTTSGDTGGIPGVTPIKPSKISSGANNTDVALSLMAAGLGMMGSRSPYAGVGIGQGGLQGVGTYEALRKQRIGEAEHQATLDQQAQIANNATAIHAAQLQEQKKLRTYQESIPHSINDPFMGQRSIFPDGKGGWYYGDTGEPVRPDQAQRMPPSKGADPNRPFQGTTATTATAMQARDKGLHGQAMLDAIPPGKRNTLEAVAFYDAPLTDFSKMGRAGMSQDTALEWVRAINPSYNQNWYGVQGQAFKNFFSGTAPQSPNVLSRGYNTAIGHAGDLAAALKDLHTADPAGFEGVLQQARESGTPFLSSLAARAQAAVTTGTKGPVADAMARINAVLPFYGAETERFYAGSTGSETGRQAIQDPFKNARSYREAMAALWQQKEMYKSKTKPLEQEYAGVMDAPGVKEYGGRDNPVKAWHIDRENAIKADATIDRIYKEAGGNPAQSGTPEGGGGGGLTPAKRAQAEQWLKNNPKDPNADAVRKRLEAQ